MFLVINFIFESKSCCSLCWYHILCIVFTICIYGDLVQLLDNVGENINGIIFILFSFNFSQNYLKNINNFFVYFLSPFVQMLLLGWVLLTLPTMNREGQVYIGKISIKVHFLMMISVFYMLY